MEFIITPEHGGKTNVPDKQFPLISCICVTRNKPAMLKRAIACFVVQRYEPKELIIVFEEDDLFTAALIASDGPHWEANIRVIRVPAVPKTSLGGLRNIGISEACGEFISQWDDDDWYHVDRLAYQYDALIKNGLDGTVMMHWMLYDSVDQRAYISHSRTWEGSILCRKAVLQEKPYADQTSGEDTPTVNYLASTGCMHLMENEPRLYIYIYHGNNTWDREHWKDFFNLGKPLSDIDSTEISGILNGKYPVREGSRLLDELLTRFYSGTAGEEPIISCDEYKE
jgi:glycosyltransferase involved in cell wall biosynthesis